jgi:MerR family transcriptional regulator, light-induced transcriptional regulator
VWTIRDPEPSSGRGGAEPPAGGHEPGPSHDLTDREDLVPVSDPRAVLRIGEVSRRTGVAVPTLRAWERRYGLLTPDRTEGGHRLYSERDIERVRAMLRLLEDGWSAAAAAREVLREPASVTHLRPIAGEGVASRELVARLQAAIEAFDGASADGVVDDVFARLQVPRALDEVLLPVLRRVGDGWQDDPTVIAREHFATNTLRPRLQRLLRTSAARSGAPRRLLAATPEQEEHDLGLLAACVVAADAGWQVHYLGARTPSSAIARSVAELRPDVVLIGAMFREHAERYLADAPDLAGAALTLGGAGFTPADAARLPDAVVHEGPLVEVVASLERALEARDRAG